MRQVRLPRQEAVAEAVRALGEGGGSPLAIVDDGHDRDLVLRGALAGGIGARAIGARPLCGWLPGDAGGFAHLCSIDRSADVRFTAAGTLLLARIYLGVLRESELRSPLAVAKACRDILVERQILGSEPMPEELDSLSPDQLPYEEEINLLHGLWQEYCAPGQAELAERLGSLAAGLSGPVARLRWHGREPEMLGTFLRAAAESQPVTQVTVEADGRTASLDRLWREGRGRPEGLVPPPSTCHAETMEDAARAALARICEWLSSHRGRRIGVAVFDRGLARRLHSLCLAAGIRLVDRTGWTASSMLIGDALLAMASSSLGSRTVRLRLQHLLALSGGEADGPPRGRSDEFAVDDPALIGEAEEALGAWRRLEERQPLSRWFGRLASLSLESPLADYLEDDFAAIRLRKLLNQLAVQFGADPGGGGVPVSAVEARALLLDALGNTRLLASDVSSNVHLVSPWRFSSDRFSALLLLGANADNLPAVQHDGMFGDEVRAALGLQASDATEAEMRLALAYQFTKHDEISVVWHGDAAVSPYIELLRPVPLQPPGPAWSAKDAGSATAPGHAARIRSLPASLGANSFDTLMDCPYLFYATGILRLRENQSSEDYRSSEFGSYVHQVLERFHRSLDMSAASRDGLLAQLEAAIAGHEAASQGDLRGRIYRILLEPALESYAGKIERFIGAGGRIEEVENRSEENLSIPLGELRLVCRTDRIDAYDDGRRGVVDVKTGYVKSKDITEGEKPQLALYAHVCGTDGELASIWRLKAEKGVFTTEVLRPFEGSSRGAERIHSHVIGLLGEMETEPLPANGEPEICGGCSARGLCRRLHWQQAQ